MSVIVQPSILIHFFLISLFSLRTKCFLIRNSRVMRVNLFWNCIQSAVDVSFYSEGISYLFGTGSLVYVHTFLLIYFCAFAFERVIYDFDCSHIN